MSRRLAFFGAVACAVEILLSAGSSAAPIGYQAAVLSNSPAGFYRLNDSTTTAADTSGNGQNGTYHGTAGTDYTQGVAGDGAGSDNAVTFAGTAGYVSTSTFGSLGSTLATNGMSVELLLKTTTAATQRIIGTQNASGTGETILIDTNANAAGTTTAGSTRFFIRDGSNSVITGVVSTPSLYNGSYHLLDFTYSSGAIKAYLDGTSVTTSIAGSISAAQMSNFAFPLYLGAFNPAGGTASANFSGTIDEFSIYNSALAQSDVSAHFAAAPEPSSLLLAGMGTAGLLVRRRRA